MEYIDQLLAERLQKGDVEAYRYLFQHHYAIMCRYAFMMVSDSFIAETIAGDVIYRLWENRAALEIHTSIRAYLIRSVRNQCLDYLSSSHSRLEIAESKIPEVIDHPLSTGSYEPSTALIEKELESIVAEAVSQLPDECKAVFIKSRIEGKKYQEIAEELHISVNTVKYHIKNALSQLRQSLGKYLHLIIFTTFWLNSLPVD